MAKKEIIIDAQMTMHELADQKTGEKYRVAMVPVQEAREWDNRQRSGESLATRMWAKIRPHVRHKTSDAADETTTDAGGHGAIFGGSQVAESYYDQMRMEAARGAKYDDYIRIDNESTIARRSLNVTIANVFTSVEGDESSWQIKSEDQQVQGVLEDLDKRTEMHEYVPKHARSAMKLGDGFTELVADSAFSIVRLKHLNAKYMYRNEDEYGRLVADKAFVMKDDMSTDIINFLWWQVIHTRYDHEIDSRYGTSFYRTVRRPYRQVEMMKDGVVIKWLTRSTKRYAYLIQVPTATPPAQKKKIIEDIKEGLRRDRMTDSSGNLDLRKKPALDEQDIFLTVEPDDKTSVEMFDPGGIADNYDGLYMFRDEIIVATGVPPAYIGLDKEVRGRAHLGWVDIEYARMVRNIQKLWASMQRCVYDRQLMMLGMKTGDDDQYSVIYPPISFVDERIKAEVEQIKWEVAVMAKRDLGVPTRWVLEKIIGLPEEDVEQIVANLEEPEQRAQGQGQWPSPKETRLTKDAYLGNMRVHSELMDLRDRLQFAVKHGFGREARL